jgi:hypothetical protein
MRFWILLRSATFVTSVQSSSGIALALDAILVGCVETWCLCKEGGTRKHDFLKCLFMLLVLRVCSRRNAVARENGVSGVGEMIQVLGLSPRVCVLQDQVIYP